MPFQYQHTYPVFKQNTYAKNGMVATSSPLAAQAGLEILKKGGNAVDAAIATAITLTVVEPTSNGIGGDAFAIVYHQGELHGLNSSGYSPESISIEALKARGLSEIPAFGPVPITVPGAPAAWRELSKKFGRLPFEELFEPAISYATNGYAVSSYLSKYWTSAAGKYKDLNDEIYRPWFDTFTPNGAAPKPGEIWQSKSHAQTLKKLADTHCDSFYQGDLAKSIVDHLQSIGGFLSLDDLKSYRPQWVDPISIHYRGYDIYEIPPNGQGVTALMALNILKNLAPPKDPSDTMALRWRHLCIEALKQAFTDVKATLADSDFSNFNLAYYLSDLYGESYARTIGDKARLPIHDPQPTGGTVYLCTADNEGQMVSFIQSNYMGFGSGIVVPETGIGLHNRGHNFSFDPNHPNALAPRKRPYHTIIPGFIMAQGKPLGPFGVMGGFMQPQGHLQVLSNLIDYGMSPQEALNAPRWQWLNDLEVTVEDTFSKEALDDLRARGHKITIASDNATFGRGQIILKLANGTYMGGTEMRCDGHIGLY